jgi:hypothetical protein
MAGTDPAGKLALIAPVLGIAAGAAAGFNWLSRRKQKVQEEEKTMAEQILQEKGLVVRHGGVELIEHWGIALSGLVLLLSGLFELPWPIDITSLRCRGFPGPGIISYHCRYIISLQFPSLPLHSFISFTMVFGEIGD